VRSKQAAIARKTRNRCPDYCHLAQSSGSNPTAFQAVSFQRNSTTME
jgi:hypothetical protein